LKGFNLPLLLIILLINFSAFSQSRTFDHYGLNEGISQGSVRSIVKSLDGFIWFGTQDGLNRFDGNSFKVYKHIETNKKSISGNYINKLLYSNDKIWIGTIENGICYYDINLDLFKSVGKNNTNCTSLDKDKDGNVYATYKKYGLSIFSIFQDSVHELKVEIPLLDNDELTSVCISNDYKLFVGTKLGNLFYSKDLKSFDFNKIEFDSESVKNINKILNINKDLFLGTNDGLGFYNLKNSKYYKLTLDKYFEIENNLIVYDIEIINSIYYIATDNGLYIAKDFDKNKIEFGDIDHLKGDKNDRFSITSNRVYDLLVDNDQLWIGTNKLDILYLVDPVFKIINMKSEIKLNNDFVFSIYKTEGYTFIGTRNGINCIDIQGNVTVITKENTSSKLAFNVIRGITRDNENNLWISTTKGLSIIDLTDFNPEKPNIKTIYANLKDENSLSSNNIRSVFVDEKNRIWIATFGGGILLFTGNVTSNNFKFKKFRYNKNENSISSDFVYNFSQDSKGNLWISTRSGLNRLIYKDGSSPIFKIYNRENGYFKSNSILSTYQDRDENIMWIGSHSGLYKLNLDSYEIKSFGEEEGLTNDVVYGILEDNGQNLWLSTNAGLFLFDKKTRTFTNFDGIIQSSEFNLGALFNDENHLYFGGVNGVNYFNPEEIDDLYYEGNLTFTSFLIKDKEINSDLDSKIINKNITRAERIKVAFDDFPIYLRFSDLYFAKEKNSKFVYKLTPNDEKWNALGERKEIQLLNLSPGNYKLLVQGKSNNRLWSKNPLELEILVRPPWYKSDLAYIVYFLIVMSIVILFYRFQMEKKLNRRELFRLQEVAKKNIIINKALAEKEILFKEIHHRVKNNLQVVTSILSLQERYLKNSKAIAAIKDSQRRIEAISLIHQKLYTDKSITAINMKDYIDDLVYRLINSLEIQKDRINYNSSIDEIYLEVDTVTPIGLILNELVINSIKHNVESKSLRLDIKFTKEKEDLLLSVKDNGKGLPDNFDFEKVDSYGMKMIESLSKKLKAKIEFVNKNGLNVELIIKKFKEQ